VAAREARAAQQAQEVQQAASELQRAAERETDWDTASLLLLGATAFMNGMKQARAVTTSCFTTGTMTQCTTP
jgi:hypothetical protein